jgi:hypothetical protein
MTITIETLRDQKVLASAKTIPEAITAYAKTLPASITLSGFARMDQTRTAILAEFAPGMPLNAEIIIFGATFEKLEQSGALPMQGKK